MQKYRINFNQFEDLAAKQSIVSNYAEWVSDIDTPVSIYARLAKKYPDAFLFESVIGGEKIGRYSFVGFNALELLELYDSDPYKLLEERLIQFRKHSDQLPFFHQGYVGYFSFESITSIEPSLSMCGSEYPQIYMLLVGDLIVFDKVMNKIYIIVNSLTDSVDIKSLYDKSCSRIDEIEEILSSELELDRLNLNHQTNTNLEEDFKSNTGEEEFKSMVVQAKEHIKEGDIFQVVLSHKLTKQSKVDPLLVYRILRTVNPSPYLFIYNLNLKGGKRLTLVGSSPEMLVKSTCKGNSIEEKYLEAEIRPIAGTYKRGETDVEDAELAKNLLQDDKEIAEHVMLVDLARNDLGKVCEKGSIKIVQNMVVEKYSHVMHIVSSVIGRVSKDSGLKLFKACFPAGTLSGAPKVEAIRIISKLEKEARGIYGGAIGYFGLDGMIDAAIMIRTLVISDDEVSVQAGAGIVADSNPEKELQETYNKAGALMRVIAIAENLSQMD